MSRAEQASVEAAHWIIVKNDGELSPEDQAAFEAWYETDSNKAAYWRLELGWEEADRIGALGRSGPEGSSTVDPIGERASFGKTMHRWWLPASIAASLALMAGGGQYLASERSANRDAQVAKTATFTTPIGGRRTVGFSDGSRVQLNTASRVRTAISTTSRQVWLDEGEAFFSVAHKAGQPFIVHAGDRQITVLGTKFSVRRDGGKVQVTVLEGRVRVDEMRDNKAVRSAVIGGGDIALAEGSATMVSAKSGQLVESALSWRTGMLVFEQDSLAAIADEFNRYNAKKMIITEGEVGNMRISGVFPTDDPDAFARLLRDFYGLKIEQHSAELRISN
jgi:transmembrane sensor